MKIGIVGGGVAGLAAARRLALEGHKVEVFESSETAGGLAASFKTPDGNLIERHYHHIFLGDNDIVGLLRELGLEGKIRWKSVKMGYFKDEKVRDFTTVFDILKYAPLSAKGRLGLLSFAAICKSLKTSKTIDSLTVKAWVSRYGEDVYSEIFGPLLQSKFGKHADKISASWLWGRMAARSKSKGPFSERLGYLEGSFQLMVDGMVRDIEKNGGGVNLGERVERIYDDSVRAGGRRTRFDRIISTVPLPTLKGIAKVPKRWSGIKYISSVSLVFSLEESLSDKYWINVGEKGAPFVVLIEQNNIFDGYGNGVFYTGRYLNSSDKLYKLDDTEIISLQKKYLEKMFGRKISPRWFVVNRDEYASPVYSIGYEKVMPQERLSKNVYLAGAYRVYPEDRTMGASVKSGELTAQALLKNI